MGEERCAYSLGRMHTTLPLSWSQASSFPWHTGWRALDTGGRSGVNMRNTYSMPQDYYRYVSGPIYNYVSCLTCRQVIPLDLWVNHAMLWHEPPVALSFHPLALEGCVCP
jgi:hypothetical protein